MNSEHARTGDAGRYFATVNLYNARMDSLFIFFQHIIPQHLLSRITGWLAEVRHPVWLKDFVIGQFVDHFEVDMAEVATGQIIHLSDVSLPEGVTSVALALGGDHDLAIASIIAPSHHVWIGY